MCYSQEAGTIARASDGNYYEVVFAGDVIPFVKWQKMVRATFGLGRFKRNRENFKIKWAGIYGKKGGANCSKVMVAIGNCTTT